MHTQRHTHTQAHRETTDTCTHRHGAKSARMHRLCYCILCRFFLRAGWHLAFVRVTNLSSGESAMFP